MGKTSDLRKWQPVASNCIPLNGRHAVPYRSRTMRFREGAPERHQLDAWLAEVEEEPAGVGRLLWVASHDWGSPNALPRPPQRELQPPTEKVGWRRVRWPGPVLRA